MESIVPSSKDFRTVLCAAAMLAIAVVSRGQNIGQSQINKSSERIVFFTGRVTLDDGSVPTERVLIQRVCDGRFELTSQIAALVDRMP